MAGNSIEFKELVTVCSGWWGCSSTLQIRETLTRATLCNRLTAQHNTKNAPYIGASVTSSECQSALLGPATYRIPQWNNWSGRHCGTWRSTDSSGTVTQTFPDNAPWNTAVPSDGIQFVRQSVTFLTNEAVRGDMGLELLSGRRDRAKLKWWYKLASMPEDTQSNYSVGNGKLSLIEVDKGKHGK